VLAGPARAGDSLPWSDSAPPWDELFRRLPPALRAVAIASRHQVQIVHTRVERRSGQPPRLIHHRYGADPAPWFAAASLVKLPAAALALERVALHGLDGSARIVLDAPPASGDWPPAESLDQTVERCIRRVITVSDNAEYNRLYEFLGPDAIQARLAQLGFADARLIARLGSFDPVANRAVGGSRLLRADGALIERRPPRRSAIAWRYPFGQVLRGRGWMDGETLVPGPHDFSHANFIPLDTMHQMVAGLAVPDAIPAIRRFDHSPALCALLVEAMSLFPRQCPDPRYDAREYPDNWAKFLVVGDSNAQAPDWLRHVGKSGMAYGYLSDCAWLADVDAGVECIVSAVVHANADGVFNDDRYEYETVALPFLAALGRAALALARERQG
jgi:hypothetical protein